MKMTNTENNKAWYDERIACLKEFMTEERFALFEKVLADRTRYVTVLAENMYHSQNAAALVRHCDAFGVQTLNTVEELCDFCPNSAISRGSDRWIDVCQYSSTGAALDALKAEGYRIVATSPHCNDTTPETFDVEKGKFVLVFGTEKEGISDEVMSRADEFLRIPMCGMVESLNVSASAAILLYGLSSRVRSQVDGWQLSEEERSRVLYKWCRFSVNDAPQILNRKFGDPL